MKHFRGEDLGCTRCDFYQYALKDHFCQRGKHMGYKKCGWYWIEQKEPAWNGVDTLRKAISILKDGIRWDDHDDLRVCLAMLERIEFANKGIIKRQAGVVAANGNGAEGE